MEINTADIENGVISQSIIDAQEAYKEENGKYQRVEPVTEGDYTLRVDEAVHPDGTVSYAVFATKVDGDKTFARKVGEGEWVEVINELE